MFSPLKNKILIERDAAPDTLNFGNLELATVDAYKEKQEYGTVLAIGPTVDSTIKVGSRVLIGKHDGAVIDSKYVGKDGDYIVIRDEAVRAVIG